MNQIDFINNSKEHRETAKLLIITDGVTANGKLKQLKNVSNTQLTAILESMSAEELHTFATHPDINWTEDAQAPVKADEVAVPFSANGDEMVTVVTKDGDKITAVNLPLHSISGNGNFNFVRANGDVVTHSGDRLRILHTMENGLNIGDKLPFKPESIVPAKTKGYFYGVPNYTGSDKLAQLEQYAIALTMSIKARKAELRQLDTSEAVIQQTILEEFGSKEESMVKKPKRPVFA